jgi:hypothetical protein
MMAVQTDVRPHTPTNRQPGDARKPHRAFWPILLLLVMVLAGVAGVYVTSRVTDSPAPPQVVTTREPTENEKEGRVPAAATREPTENEKEGRIPPGR